VVDVDLLDTTREPGRTCLPIGFLAKGVVVVDVLVPTTGAVGLEARGRDDGVPMEEIPLVRGLLRLPMDGRVLMAFWGTGRLDLAMGSLDMRGMPDERGKLGVAGPAASDGSIFWN
jgi:hypothetical protein